MSSLDTLKELLTQQNQAFEAFKQANDERLKQLEQKGTADAVTVAKVETLSAELDKIGETLRALEKLATRPPMGGEGGGDKAMQRLAAFNTQMQFLGADRGRATKLASAEEVERYGAEFLSYLRTGRADALQAWERQDFRVAADGDGGYLVPPDMSGRIVAKLFETSDFRAICGIATTSRGELVGIADTADVSYWWAGEAEPDADSTNDAMGEYSIMLEELRAQPKISLRLLDDAAVDVEGWVTGKVAAALSRGENAAFTQGNGVKKPRGFLTYPLSTAADSARAWGKLQYVATGASGAFKTSDTPTAPADCLISLVYALKPAYRQNARWVAARATFAAVRKLKDSDGNYLWQPGIQAGQPATILNYPVTEAEDMPALADVDGNPVANALGMAFGDFQEGYTILDRPGITILRDPYTAKGYVKLFTRKRVGGGVVNFQAIKLLKFGTA